MTAFQFAKRVTGGSSYSYYLSVRAARESGIGKSDQIRAGLDVDTCDFLLIVGRCHTVGGRQSRPKMLEGGVEEWVGWRQSVCACEMVKDGRGRGVFKGATQYKMNNN